MKKVSSGLKNFFLLYFLYKEKANREVSGHCKTENFAVWYDESGALAIFHIGFTIYKPIGAKPQSSGLLNLACFSAKGALLERTQVPSFANTTARGAARQTAPKRAQNMTKIAKFSKKTQKILTF